MMTAPQAAAVTAIAAAIGGGLSSMQVPLNVAAMPHGFNSAPATGVAVQTLFLICILRWNWTVSHFSADRYRMTKKIGDGTFGEVSLAIKLDTGDVVAIKR